MDEMEKELIMWSTFFSLIPVGIVRIDNAGNLRSKIGGLQLLHMLSKRLLAVGWN